MKMLSSLAGIAAIAALFLPASVFGQATVGSPAPQFTATDSRGQTHSLSEYRGKYVVLEWHNHDCPYTRKHYVSGNMEGLQKEWTAKGVAWFTVISSAKGEQGYMTDAEENAFLEKMHARPRF
jgi:glutathione peroxidase-family protein